MRIHKQFRPKHGKLASSTNDAWDSNNCKVVLTDIEFRANSWIKTENALIDNYRMNDVRKAGENGRRIIFAAKEKEKGKLNTKRVI